MGKKNKKEKVKKKICFLGSVSQIDTIDIIADYLGLTNYDVEVIYKPSKKDREFRGYDYIIQDRFNAIRNADEVVIIRHDKNSEVDRALLYEIAFAEHIGTPITYLNKRQVRLISYLYSVATGEGAV